MSTGPRASKAPCGRLSKAAIGWAAAQLLLCVLAAPLAARTFDFNDGTAQGWTAFGALEPETEEVYDSAFAGLWWDGASYPSLEDPIGNGAGCYALEADQGPGFSVPGKTWWIMQLVSPDLRASEDWQTADGYRARLSSSMGPGDLYVNLFVKVWDYDQARYRYFYDDTAQPLLSSASWEQRSFTWSFPTFPKRYAVESVHLNVWGYLAQSYSGQVFLDNVTPFRSGCSIEPGVQDAGFGEPIEVNVDLCQPRRYLRIAEVPQGKPLRVSLTDSTVQDRNALYVRWGEQATPYAFDQSAAAPDRASQSLIIPESREEALFVCMSAQTVVGETSLLRLDIQQVDLALESFSTRYAGGESRRVTGTALGGGFNEQTGFALRLRGGIESHPAAESFVLSSRRAELGFDLSRASAGKYDLVAQRGGDSAILSEAFELRDTEVGPGVELRFEAPTFYRYGRTAALTLSYVNLGDVAVPAPMVKVVAPAGTSLQLERDPNASGSEVQAFAIDPDGIAGTLAPGAGGSIALSFVSTACPSCELTFEAHLFTPNREDRVGWAGLPPPQGMTAGAWSTARPELEAHLGATWSQLAEALAERASRLSRRGKPAESVLESFRFAVREALDMPTGAVLGTLVEGSTGTPLGGRDVLALLGGDVRSSVISDPQGKFALDWLRPGSTYTLAVAGLNVGSPSVTIPLEADVLDRRLTVVTGSNALVPACPDCNPANLPLAPLGPPGELFTRVAEAKVTVISSWDPNEKDGPIGPGEEPFIGAAEEVVYRIYFENLETATAAAQRVEVIDQLEGDLDWTTFRMRDFQLGAQSEEVLVSTSTEDDLFGGYTSSALSYGGSGQVEVFQEVEGSSESVLVDTEYELDLATGELRWLFELETPDPSSPDGFLLPNDDLKQGEGYVEFSVKPRAGLAEGTEIENVATIHFDENEPITTNAWKNVVTYLLMPGAPTDPVPANGVSHLVDTDVTTSWTRPAHAAMFDIFIWEEGTARPTLPTATGLEAPFFRVAAPLATDTTYRWQVVAKNARGSTPGEIWRFRTLASRMFIRGDATGDGEVDISDPIYTLGSLFLGEPAPPCEKAADSNDLGDVDISDAVYTLGALFLGDPEPPPPNAVCGLDPTPDELPCESHPFCDGAP